MKKLSLLALIMIGGLTGQSSYAQAVMAPLKTSTSQYTPEELVTKVLINDPSVIVSNITYSTGTNFGSVNGIGSFDASESDFPIKKGIVLSTGSVASIGGPNTSILSEGSSSWTGDADLEKIITAATGSSANSFNASKLEFDFVAQSDKLKFDFLFTSEEYGQNQCGFRDMLAILLSRKGGSVISNLAVLPDPSKPNTPISTVTIRDKMYNPDCSSENIKYFDRFYGTNGIDPALAPINFNGQTMPLIAQAEIIPGQVYHIKFVIADRNSTAYDSAIFIEAGNLDQEPLTAPTFESQNIMLFPNPTAEKFQISMQNSNETFESIAVYDLLGHLVRKIVNTGSNHSEIGVGDLAKGVYLVEITTQNQFKSTQKLIVK